MNLPPVLRQRYLDSNGVPLAGGLLYSYQAGTTTPQATYTDQTGGTPNTNPIVLDSKGEASMWLDPSLSYKFVLEDANSVVQWTIDNVVGILTANSVTTASIQDGAVTSSKLAAGAVNAAALLSDSSVDANRPVNTNNIRDSAIIRSKISSAAFTAINLQSFLSGSGTYYPTYTFFVSSANATAGATYTNNGQTFTVVNTISGGTTLKGTGTGLPLTSGTLTKTSGTGDATIAFTSYLAPLYIRVRMAGAGGGGAGGAGSNGGAGGNTTFGTSLLVANGGAGGTTNAGVGPGIGGAGGTASLGTGPIGIALAGGSGSGNNYGANLAGGSGGANAFGGAGGGGGWSNPGSNGVTNTGGGGGGGGIQAGTFASGAGGGAGGYIDAIIISPSTSYAYAIGAAGTSGAGGGTGYGAGGSGGSGVIYVEEFYQ